MLPSKQLYDILHEVEFFKDAKIFLFDVPQKEIRVQKIPLLRVTELSGDSEWASNLPVTYNGLVQLDIWDTKLSRIEEYYFEIDKILAERGFNVVTTLLDYDEEIENCPRTIKRYAKQVQL